MSGRLDESVAELTGIFYEQSNLDIVNITKISKINLVFFLSCYFVGKVVHSFKILMIQVAPLPVHQILTDRTELSALSWSLFYILDLPAHLAGAGLGGLVSSPVAPRVATDTLMPGPSETSASANQRLQTGLGDQSEAELAQAAVEHHTGHNGPIQGWRDQG